VKVSDIQPWPVALHPYRSAEVNSAFCPPWDNKVSINFRSE